jgi:hypothetical protein
VGIRLALLVALASVLSTVGKPAAAGTALPSCAPEGWGLEEAVPHMSHTQPTVLVTAGWVAGTERRHKCTVHTTIRLTIVGSGHVTLHRRWHVNAVLDPWGSVVHTWAWRNWCETGSQGDVHVGVSLPRGRTIRQLIDYPPECVSAGLPSTLVDRGTGTRYVRRPGSRIPPHILPAWVPPPLHQELVKVKNAWLVSDGYTLVAVYAGSPGNHPSIGRFAFVRQNLIFGIQYDPPDIVNVGRVGAVRITRAPQGRSRETSAQHGQLSFASADGTRGVLDLTGDRVRITTRP